MLDTIENFLAAPPEDAGTIYNERSLQLELGYHFRCQKFGVEFERPFKAPRPAGSTNKPKTNLDLLVTGNDKRVAIELKVPLNKRHPETLYDYCADIEFVEALVRNGQVDRGFCLLMTNDDVTTWQRWMAAATPKVFRIVTISSRTAAAAFGRTVGAAVKFTIVSARRAPS